LLLGILLHPLAFLLVPVYLWADPGRHAVHLLLRKPARAVVIMVLQFLGQSVACTALLIGSFRARRLVL
jgi:hypothetical protein